MITEMAATKLQVIDWGGLDLSKNNDGTVKKTDGIRVEGNRGNNRPRKK